jgi:hypothetical protein
MKSYPRQPYDAMILHSIGKLFVVAMTIAVSISGLKAFSISHLDAQIPASSDPTKFSLTVEEGNPSGNYAAGTQVTVSANVPTAGAQFAGWKGDIAILANPSSPTTTATVPFRAVTITATYTDTAPATNSPRMRTQLHAD